MKRLLLVLLVLTFSFSTVTMEMDSDFDCNGCCVEEGTYLSRVYIQNTGDETITVTKMAHYIEDVGIFGMKELEKTLGPNEEMQVSLTGRFPAPTGSNILMFKQCAYVFVEGRGTNNEGWYCMDRNDNVQVTRKSSHECYTDANCGSDEYCSISGCTTKCKPIQTNNECGHFVDHVFVPYECCADADCGAGQKCSSNFCIDLDCSCGHVQNHTCIQYECCSKEDCKSGQYCDQNKCTKYECAENSDCSEESKCLGNKCIPFMCEPCEHILDHQCIKYECCSDNQCLASQRCFEKMCESILCKYAQYPQNHMCVDYECMVGADCSETQGCENNKCVDLKCENGTRIKDHKCGRVGFRDVISGIGIYLIAVLGIGWIWIVFIHKE
ncbi:MAG: hypothetical protein ABII22_02195 [Candidatus Micrarchaeota archaeon]